MLLCACGDLPGEGDVDPSDDDDVSADDDDSTGDDDDTPAPASWSQPGDAFARFTGGGAELGAVMAGGLDLDGDDLADLAFGLPEDGAEGEPIADRGRVLVVRGSSLGEGGPFELSLAADVVLSGDAEGDSFGGALAGAGDVDGDGLDDLAVGSLTRPETWIFLGASLSSATELPASEADLRVSGQVAECLRWVGDLDGDGLDELAIANTLNSGAGNVAGRTFILRGETLLASDGELEVSEAAREQLAEEGYDAEFGARPLKRAPRSG